MSIYRCKRSAGFKIHLLMMVLQVLVRLKDSLNLMHFSLICVGEGRFRARPDLGTRQGPGSENTDSHQGSELVHHHSYCILWARASHKRSSNSKGGERDLTLDKRSVESQGRREE